MRYWIVFICLFELTFNYCEGQADIKTEYLSPEMKDSLVSELAKISLEDQKYRDQVMRLGEENQDHPMMESLMKTMEEVDSINLIKVEAIISKYGWLGPDQIGSDGNTTLFMVIQHADLDAQDKYLPIIREAVKNGRAKAHHLALLEDRVALLHGEKQIYGSQISWNTKTNVYFLAPLIDPDQVDNRRKEVGLPPLKDFLLEFGMIWDPEQYKKDLPYLEEEFFKKK